MKWNQNNGRKAVCVSFDFELGWGVIDSKLWRTREKRGIYSQLRYELKTILDYADKLGFPLTIACVGAMLEKEDEWSFEHLPGEYRNQVDEFVSQAQKPTVYAGDLMDMIGDARICHEIGSHTYTHIHARHHEVTDEILLSELQKANKAIVPFSKACSSLIFPRDQVFPDGVMRNQESIFVVREPPKINRGSSQIVTPSIIKYNEWGGVTCSGSMFMNWSTGWKAPIKKEIVKRGIREFFLQDEGVFHFWLHPFNFSEVKGLSKTFIEFMEGVARERDDGKIDILVMNDFRERNDVNS